MHTVSQVKTIINKVTESGHKTFGQLAQEFTYSKNTEDPQSFRCLMGDIKKFHAQDPQILGATT
jgi:hypothetical protein